MHKHYAFDVNLTFRSERVRLVPYLRYEKDSWVECGHFYSFWTFTFSWLTFNLFIHSPD